MKTLQLGSLVLALFCLFSSCTKDSQRSSQNDLSAAAGGILGNGNPNAGGPNSQGNTDVKPAMTITYSPLTIADPPTATVGTAVTVRGSITSTPLPDCGKLQLQQIVGTTVTTVAEVNLSSTVHEVSYTFTPDVVGTYQFQVHYVPGGPGGNCTGFAQNMSDVFPLLVVEACNGLDITGKVVGEPQPVTGTNLYEFTVVYEVTTCGLQFDKLKIQGGLTNATSIVSAMDDPHVGVYDTWVPGNSTNHIQRWVETSTNGLLPTNKRTYTVTFTKAYSGSGTIELTGDWSVSLSLNGTEVGNDSFAKIYYTK